MGRLRFATHDNLFPFLLQNWNETFPINRLQHHSMERTYNNGKLIICYLWFCKHGTLQNLINNLPINIDSAKSLYYLSSLPCRPVRKVSLLQLASQNVGRFWVLAIYRNLETPLNFKFSSNTLKYNSNFFSL